MAENRFKFLMPSDPRSNEDEPSTSNRFNDLIPEGANRENRFSIETEPDKKYNLNNVELDDQRPNRFLSLMSDTPNIKKVNKYRGDPDTEFGIGDAFLLGLSDTARGITQMLGGEKVFFMDDTLKEQQEKLRKAMEGEGSGLITAAYFGGAILDPLTWLIPVLRGKKLYQMAKFGAVSGGLAGALGYVDENSLFDTRTKQALGGALGGALVTPIVGKTAQLLKVKKLKKEFGLDQDVDISKLKDSDFEFQKLPGTETLVIKDKKGKTIKTVKGRGEAFAKYRKVIPIKKIELGRDDMSKKLSPNKKNDSNFILRGPREFFKTILDGYEKVLNKYETNIGKPAFNYFTAEKGFGPELGTGLAGGFTGFALPEDENNITKRFSRAAIGFMAGFAGMYGAKNIKVGDDADKLSLATYLGRGFVDGFKMPAEIAKLRALDLGGLRGKIEIEALRAAQMASQLTLDERKILYNVLEGDIAYDVAPKAIAKLGKEARERIDAISQQYIDAGILTAETVQRNIKRYIRRAYAGEDLAKLGSDLKARGAIEEITPDEWVKKYSKEKAFKIDDAGKTVPIEDHKGWELFGNLKDPNTGKLTNERATVEKIKKLARNKKTKNEPIATIRWEYTKQERIGMGEIEDGAFAILETGRLMSQTLPQYKFYADIAELPFVKTKKPTDEVIRELDLVQMPTTIREGTIQPVYGKLSGTYVPREVKENLINMYKASQGTSNKGLKAYKFLNQFWKSSKTAWNPTVHVNNIVSNFVLTDLVDGNIFLLPKAIRAFTDAAKGKRSKVLELAQTHGVFDVDYVTRELNLLDPKKINPNIYKYDESKDVFENSVGIAKFFYKDVILKDKIGLQKLSDWYRSEDATFRLALFMDRLNKGYSPVDAAMDARKSFIDYNISAPGINAMRALPTPFLAYTYRVVPILAETAVVRPWKFAKYAVLGYTLNNLGELVGTGDTETERKLFTKERQGRIFGLPFLPHREIKMPFAPISQKGMKDPIGSYYLNVTRYVPGGDIFDLSSGTVPLLPAPLQPSFGIAGDVLLPMLGYDLFGADKIKGQGISEFDDFNVRAKAAAQRIMPNFPFVPGGYSTKRIERARKGESKFAPDESEFIAFLNSVGIKLSKADIPRLRKIKSFEFRRRIGGIKDQRSILNKKLRNGEIDRTEYEEEITKLKDKYRKIRKVYADSINAEVNEKEPIQIGVPFTKDFEKGQVLETIGTAIKEQTKEVFGKK